MENGRYLVQAANEMFLLLASSEPEEENLHKCAGLGCVAFRRLAEDREFFYAAEELAKRQREDREAFRIITEVDHFVRYFLRKEEEFLKNKLGLDIRLVQEVADRVKGLRVAVRATVIQPEALYETVKQLRDGICEMETLMAGQKTRQEQRALVRKRLKWAVLGMSGLVIVGGNTSALALTFGFSLAGTAVSGAAGSALVGAAAAEALK